MSLISYYFHSAGTSDEKVNKWGHESFEHFRNLYYSDRADRAGVQLITAYNLLTSGQDTSPPSWKHIVSNFRILEKHDLESLGVPIRYIAGYVFFNE